MPNSKYSSIPDTLLNDAKSVNDGTYDVHIMTLTVLFKAHKRKKDKYNDLINHISNKPKTYHN